MGEGSRIVVLGNSGSGKSSLARRVSQRWGAAHLDLDSVAWSEANPPVRADFASSCEAIDRFLTSHSKWVVEGCYSSLIEYAARSADQFFFLNIGVEGCIANCRARPWEPEKYPSRQAQDEKLAMLIDWVRTYETREDEFSFNEHRRVYESFSGAKRELKSNEETQSLLTSQAGTSGL